MYSVGVLDCVLGVGDGLLVWYVVICGLFD